MVRGLVPYLALRCWLRCLQSRQVPLFPAPSAGAYGGCVECTARRQQEGPPTRARARRGLIWGRACEHGPTRGPEGAEAGVQHAERPGRGMPTRNEMVSVTGFLSMPVGAGRRLTTNADTRGASRALWGMGRTREREVRHARPRQVGRRDVEPERFRALARAQRFGSCRTASEGCSLVTCRRRMVVALRWRGSVMRVGVEVIR